MYEEDGSPLTTGGDDSNEKPTGRQEVDISGDDGEGGEVAEKTCHSRQWLSGIHIGVVWDGFLEEVRSQNCTRCPVVSLGTSENEVVGQSPQHRTVANSGEQYRT